MECMNIRFLLGPDAAQEEADPTHASHLGLEVAAVLVDLRAEYTNLGAGIRHCAVSSEHRANTREATTVNTAEYGRIQLNTCPLERYLIYKNLSRF